MTVYFLVKLSSFYELVTVIVVDTCLGSVLRVVHLCECYRPEFVDVSERDPRNVKCTDHVHPPLTGQEYKVIHPYSSQLCVPRNPTWTEDYSEDKAAPLKPDYYSPTIFLIKGGNPQ